MSETIPDDVMETAVQHAMSLGYPSGYEETKLAFARAIATERERCAKTAYDGLRDGIDTPEAIAAAIRGTDDPLGGLSSEDFVRKHRDEWR